MPRKTRETAQQDERSPGIAAVLNFIIWGTGYIYGGKKLILGIGLLISMLITIVPVFYLGPGWYFHTPGLFFTIAHFIMSILFGVDAYIDMKN